MHQQVRFQPRTTISKVREYPSTISFDTEGKPILVFNCFYWYREKLSSRHRRNCIRERQKVKISYESILLKIQEIGPVSYLVETGIFRNHGKYYGQKMTNTHINGYHFLQKKVLWKSRNAITNTQFWNAPTVFCHFWAKEKRKSILGKIKRSKYRKLGQKQQLSDSRKHATLYLLSRPSTSNFPFSRWRLKVTPKSTHYVDRLWHSWWLCSFTQFYFHQVF